jgi:uncharacterized protein
MKKTALITGASNGIGKELAIIHAKNKGDLVLVARRMNLLEELKTELEKQFGISVKLIAKDLSKREAAKEIYDEIKAEGIQIDYLINNAGFGGYGKFHERSAGDDLSMIDVNVVSSTMLSKYFLPDMVKRNSGKIMNVASTAAFMPGPLQAVYFATKAFVISLSQALADEVSDTNVTITALCPGATATGFAKKADIENTALFKKAASAESVALKGYNAMLKGKRVIITDGPQKFLIKFLIPFAPMKMVMKVTRKLQEK